MDQVVEVTRHPSSEGVHHEVHLFFHHLHLCDYVRRSRICAGRTAGILSFLPTWCVVAFQPFLVPSFNTVFFLVSLLGVKRCVLLVKLFLQVMILLDEAFHHCC